MFKGLKILGKGSNSLSSNIASCPVTPTSVYVLLHVHLSHAALSQAVLSCDMPWLTATSPDSRQTQLLPRLHGTATSAGIFGTFATTRLSCANYHCVQELLEKANSVSLEKEVRNHIINNSYTTNRMECISIQHRADDFPFCNRGGCKEATLEYYPLPLTSVFPGNILSPNHSSYIYKNEANFWKFQKHKY